VHTRQLMEGKFVLAFFNPLVAWIIA
jgi:hypothetical protein